MQILLKYTQTSKLRVSLSTIYRLVSQSCTGFDVDQLTNSVKRDIESHWRQKLSSGQFNKNAPSNKFYVLSMFPYPSGNLHMGHVRVYAISDTVARFHRMNGKNVFHPIGWDAFGLPAENAAIQRGIEPASWTNQNITQMRDQLQKLGCSFDWNHELSTCCPDYYKWTQKLFLMLHEQGLAYQNEALVNWDPVDKTVLADEQVDANGCSWRSGAKVEKKLLKQWFIRTTKFAKELLEGLNDPTLQDWRDIINLQRHWIGECDGYAFQLGPLRVWTQSPEHLMDPNAYLILKTTHYLKKSPNPPEFVKNPFTGESIPIVYSDDAEFAPKCDVFLAAPSFMESEKDIFTELNVKLDVSKDVASKACRNSILEKAKKLQIGGYKVSSKLQDWLISRQRYWGTPIPIIHCPECGPVAVPEKDLPIQLPAEKTKEMLRVDCPKCGHCDAHRESDTMDTFVDSSWYYLRYLDANNPDRIFDKDLISKCMPVDLYIGGKEHAVLHLYYARFMNHFLHSQGLVPCSEPFSRLLVQGMVMGRSFRLKGSGKYLTEDQVDIVDAKKNKAITKDTKEAVVMSWEKMSKSKFNGVDPSDMINEYGTDTTRLIILADVAPTSHRNWSTTTFPGILNWQKRLWLTIDTFHKLRQEPPSPEFNPTDEKFIQEDSVLFDARNYYVAGATFNYRHTHQLSVAISKMQGLTNSIRRASKDVIKYGKHFERALATQIIMLAPMAPHFASELWSKLISTPNRLNEKLEDIQWDKDVLEQRWPDVDSEYQLDLTIKVNGFENAVIKIRRSNIDRITHSDAMDIAFNTNSVTSYLTDKKIRTTNFVLYPGIEAILNIYVDKATQTKEEGTADIKAKKD
ncbi:leucine--tRNA ligase, mitochondrial [Eupeodes corollae]|uniref:leucine--tRNA ligase, mitochondrial n=1 Tax=Eupeodes corollae TaxID=290404 RepID=UPI0024924525|nr:leucine--tRNA ligase, mitochondrial [Eupeodes corollae]